MITMRAEPPAIEQVARMLKVLQPGAPPLQWPPGPSHTELNAMAEIVNKPVTMLLHDDDPIYAYKDCVDQGHPVLLHADGKDYNDLRRVPDQLLTLAPIKLKLKNVPVGLALRWLKHRTQFAAAEDAELIFQASMHADQKIRIGPIAGIKHSTWAVAGRSVRFIELPEEKRALNWQQQDAAFEAILQEKLIPHLELFPSWPEQKGLRVLKGRVLLHGPTIPVARALQLLKQWEKEGEINEPAWVVHLEKKLDQEIDWNGRGLTGGKLIKRLRAIGDFGLFLEPSANGTPPAFHTDTSSSRVTLSRHLPHA